ncbi:MAG: response regulator [bacterium]
MERIFVVEDDEETRESWKGLFQSKGWEVTPASSAEEAWKIINSSPSFDVAVVDMCLSPEDKEGIGGLNTIKVINKKDPSTQIIAVSTYLDIEDVLNNIYKALKYHLYQYLDKKREDFGKILLSQIENAIIYKENLREGRVIPKTLPAYASHSKRNKELVEGLVKYGKLTEGDVQKYITEARREGMGLEAYLRYKKIIDGGVLTFILGKVLDTTDYEQINTYNPSIDKEEKRAILLKFLKLQGLVPAGWDGNKLLIKMGFPNNEGLEMIKGIVRKDVISLPSSQREVEEEIENLFLE